jgi:hypothetical protein
MLCVPCIYPAHPAAAAVTLVHLVLSLLAWPAAYRAVCAVALPCGSPAAWRLVAVVCVERPASQSHTNTATSGSACIARV